MTEINFNKNRYVYGKFYDSSRVKIPTNEQKYDIIIYINPLRETSRTICSLEGYFVSEMPLMKNGEEGWTDLRNNPLVQRDEMNAFAKKYEGEFVPFEKKEK